VDAENHVFLTLTLVGGEWPALHPGRFIPRKSPLDRRVGRPPELVWTMWRSALVPTGSS
jgi:hypothetical protein